MTGSRELILKLFRAALKSVDPAAAVARAIRCQEREITVGYQRFEAKGRVIVVGTGKAAVPMARGIDLTCGCAIESGLLLTKDGLGRGSPARFTVREAAHPIPDERGVAATQEMLELVGTCGAGDVVIALISGGGSALLEAPRPPVALSDLAQTTELLLRAGAPISDLNAVRIPLSLVKGGGLRQAAPDARFITLILSDVIGNDLATIASGPTIPANPTSAAPISILEQYRVMERVPPAVIDLLNGLASNDAPGFGNVDDDIVTIIADNEAAIEAARLEAAASNLSVKVIWKGTTGEAADLGKDWARACLEAGDDVDVLIGGGEATVTVRGDGVGGRNTEFALSAGHELERLGVTSWTIASLATDGDDGTSGLAGANADATTFQRARNAGLDPELSLEVNDSATVFRAIGDAVDTGLTGTNVNDLYFAVRDHLL